MNQVTQVKTQLRLEHWKQLISKCQESGMSVSHGVRKTMSLNHHTITI